MRHALRQLPQKTSLVCYAENVFLMQQASTPLYGMYFQAQNAHLYSG